MSEYVKIELTEEALQRIIDHCKVAENKADDVQDVLDLKMDKSNPSGTGSFSMNRAKGIVGLNSHAEGSGNVASGAYSHAEGGQTKATGSGSHAEGNFTVAIGKNSHAEGWDNKAVGENSHAEGTQTYALGKASHVGGIHTEANYDYQTVVGRFNDNKSNTLFEVGNGADAENLNNALEVRQNGDVYIDGDFYNGAGEKVEPFGKAFFVSFTGTSNGNNYSYSCDKTYSQIREHFDAHDLIVAHYYDVLDEYEMSTSLVGVDAGADELYFRFFISHIGTSIFYQDVMINSTDTITSGGFKATKEIPNVGMSDVGKVLSVNSNGDYYVKALDNTPTQSSINPISSGGVYAELVPTVITKSGNPITISDACALYCKSLEMDIEATQDLNGYDKPWVGGAGKNKLNPVVTSQTIDGITVTKNNDGSYLCKGQATANVMLYFDTFNTDGNNYILSGCPPTGSYSTYCLGVVDNGKDYGTGLTFSNSEKPYIRIANGYECPTDGLLFKPMIRLASVSDATFEPYANICPITGISTATITNGTSTASITLGEEVFGGTIDFNSGLVNVTHGVATFDGSNDEGWVKNIDTTDNSYTCEVNEQWEPFWAVDQSSNGVSNEFNVNGEVAYWGTDYAMAYSNGRLYVGFPKASTLADFTSALASNNLQIVGKLATPRTLTLTPSQLELLASGQTVSGNGAEIRLSYLKRNIAGQIIEEVKSLD